MLQLNYDNLAIDLTPIELRTVAQLEWLKTLTKPIKDLDTDVNTYHSSIIYDVQHTGQVLALEHYLNNYFSLPFPKLIPNSIYITNGEWFTELYSFKLGADSFSDLNNFGTVNLSEPSDGQMYTFNEGEGADSIQDTIYSYSVSEYGTDQLDFYINIETGWEAANPDAVDQIKEIVNRYKKIGHTFKVIVY